MSILLEVDVESAGVRLTSFRFNLNAVVLAVFGNEMNPMMVAAKSFLIVGIWFAKDIVIVGKG